MLHPCHKCVTVSNELRSRHFPPENRVSHPCDTRATQGLHPGKGNISGNTRKPRRWPCTRPMIVTVTRTMIVTTTKIVTTCTWTAAVDLHPFEATVVWPSSAWPADGANGPPEARRRDGTPGKVSKAMSANDATAWRIRDVAVQDQPAAVVGFEPLDLHRRTTFEPDPPSVRRKVPRISRFLREPQLAGVRIGKPGARSDDGRLRRALTDTRIRRPEAESGDDCREPRRLCGWRGQR